MRQKLEQSDLDDLSAHLDGQLDADRAAGVAELIRSDPAWREAWDQLWALDRMLDVYDVPPAPGGLDDRILESVRARVRRRKVLRRVWPLAGAAAAAAAVIVVLLVNSAQPGPGTRTPEATAQAPGLVDPSPQEVEQAIIEHLDFVRDLNVLENYETLEAIERVELASRGN